MASPRHLYRAIALLAAASQPVSGWTEDADQQLGTVTVTGSRIARSQVEGPSPVNVISGQELEARGYRNVYEALATQTQNTGFTQGEDFGNTFTPAASALDLRGLGPNHTLVLINGRRVADYPSAYEGTVNFTNLANIPSSAIERIEVLSSGASSVYGSDAIAGVVNIIMKDKTSGVDVNLRSGAAERGGGTNHRLQLTGGNTWGDFDGLFSLEITRRAPIWAYQRGFMDREIEGRDVGYRRDLLGDRYLGPGCGAYRGLFGNHLQDRDGRCYTDQYYNNYWTLQTKKENYDGYAHGNWHFSDKGKVFADLLLGLDHIQNNTRGPSFTSPDFYNENTGQVERWYRQFGPEEIGGHTSNNGKWRDVSWTGTLGLENSIGDSGWNYQLSATRSQYRSNRSSYYYPLTGIQDFYLGPQRGEKDGYPAFEPDQSRLDRPLTPQEWRLFRTRQGEQSKSVNEALTGSITGELFNLPAGPVEFAGVVEAGRQEYSVHPDPGLAAGDFYQRPGQENSGGSRDRYAFGGEFSIPVSDSLLASAAGRWDQYRFSGRHEQQQTYDLGLEWRPSSHWLVRGHYGTSFRAPDLNYLYQLETHGYYPDQIDYYGCTQGVEKACDRDRVDFVQNGSQSLKSERGKSWTYGVVWSPSSSFDLSADLWRVEIDDLLTLVDQNRLLRDEANCRASGSTDNYCTGVLARIERNPADAAIDPNKLQQVHVNAINAASERASGLDLKSNQRWDAGRYGRFSSALGYTLVLSHYYKEAKDAPTLNQRDSLSSQDWRSKVNASLTWDWRDFTTTFLMVHYGSVTNSGGDGRLTPWTTLNASARYQFNKKASLGLSVNNLLNKVKKDDSAGWPYYPSSLYDPYGRQWWLDFSYHFGS